jgi:cytochrome c peroxidase
VKSAITITAIVLLGLFFHSCFKDSNLLSPTARPLPIPAGFPQPQSYVNGISFTQEGFELGRKLFHDGQISSDGNHPCASCHEPRAAFTTFQHDRSHGVGNSHTLRNAPGLANLAWYPVLNQDGSGSSLHEIYLKHITKSDEMGEDINNVVRKIRNDASYKPLFRGAFGNDEVTAEKLFRGLDQYLLQLVSANAKYRPRAGRQGRVHPAGAAGMDPFPEQMFVLPQRAPVHRFLLPQYRPPGGSHPQRFWPHARDRQPR